MSRSFSQPGDAPCPKCGQAMHFEIWLIVDLTEHPELAQRIREGKIHSLTCAHCGYEGGANAPLLIHDPEKRRIIFAPPRQASEEEVGQMYGGLMNQLAGNFSAQPPEYFGRAVGAPHELLPDLIDAEDIQSALHEALCAGQAGPAH